MLKSQEMRNELKVLNDQAMELMAKAGVTAEEINAKKAEIETLKAKIAMQEQIEEDEKADAMDNGNMKPLGEEETENSLSVGEIIAKAIVGIASKEELVQIKNLIQESVGENGGLVVPKDVKTKIIELQRKAFDIRKYVEVEPTEVLKGSRVKESNEPEAAGFASVDEGADIQALHEPTLIEVEYAIRKYAGYIPVTNELLEDSPENILAYLIKWMAKNELNTYAYQVFQGTGVKAAEGIMTDAVKVDGKLKDRIQKLDTAPTVKTFKSIINKDLDDVDTDNIVIFTNADGYDYLDNLEDANKKPYLQPDVTKASGYTFLGKEIVKVPSKFLANIDDAGTSRTPFVIGDLKLLYTMYDRKQMIIESTKIGGNAWRQDKTEVKGAFRFDGKINGDVKAIKILLAKLA